MGVLSAPGWRKTFAGPSLQGGHGTWEGVQEPPTPWPGEVSRPPCWKVVRGQPMGPQKKLLFSSPLLRAGRVMKLSTYFWAKRDLEVVKKNFGRLLEVEKSFLQELRASQILVTLCLDGFCGSPEFQLPPQNAEKKMGKKPQNYLKWILFSFWGSPKHPPKIQTCQKWWERRKIRIFPTGFFFTFSSLV